MHALDGVALSDEAGDFCVQTHLPAVEFGIQHVGGAQAERIYAAVGNLHGANQVRIHAGLQAFGQLRIDNLRSNSRFLAGVYERLLIAQVILRQGDEQAVGFVYAVGGNPAQNHVLADAFLRTLCVVHGVPRSGVEQAVVASRCSGSNVRAFNQERAEAAHGAVPLGAGSRDAASDDNHVKFVGIHVCVLLIATNLPIIFQKTNIHLTMCHKALGPFFFCDNYVFDTPLFIQ